MMFSKFWSERVKSVAPSRTEKLPVQNRKQKLTV